MKRTRRIVGARLPVAHARLTHRRRPDADHDLALGHMPVSHHAPIAVVGLQIDGRGQKLGPSVSTGSVKSARTPLRRTSVSRSVKIPGSISLTTLPSDTAYRSISGEAEGRTPREMPPSPIYPLTSFRP